MKPEKKIYYSLFLPLILVGLAWLVFLFEFYTKISLSFLGIYPLKLMGLTGIIFSPFLHGDLNHLIANTLPFFVLTWALFYYYRQLALKILFLGWFITGLWVWLFARDSYHIGASGLIYFLVFFHFFSGILRKNKSLVAFSLLVIFLYGSLFWGVFPDFFPHQNISWESHLMGGIAGILLSWYFKGNGPPDDYFNWEREEEDLDEESLENINIPPEDSSQNTIITYDYTENKKESQ